MILVSLPLVLTIYTQAHDLHRKPTSQAFKSLSSASALPQEGDKITVGKITVGKIGTNDMLTFEEKNVSPLLCWRCTSSTRGR